LQPDIHRQIIKQIWCLVDVKHHDQRFSSSAKQGELGVTLVARIVSGSFGWLFKRNHQEHDFGIDGQLEVVTDSGAVTGQLLAVQIKCGKSFLQEENKWGYVYRGELKHFNYLSNYPIPVLIVICDPDSGECFWVCFQPEQTQTTKAGWKITVPFENKSPMSSTTIRLSPTASKWCSSPTTA
jgi:hypothetical protein